MVRQQTKRRVRVILLLLALALSGATSITASVIIKMRINTPPQHSDIETSVLNAVTLSSDPQIENLASLLLLADKAYIATMRMMNQLGHLLATMGVTILVVTAVLFFETRVPLDKTKPNQTY